MNFATVLFASAFIISGVAEFYSIAGLVSIFSSQPWASIIMGAALGVGKLVAASWVYRNWNTTSRMLKYYFSSAVVILSIITSMGIFGYLSKAHLDQSVIIGESASKMSIYDEKIKTSKDNIDANRKALKQMDEAVDQVMARSSSETGADKAVSIRRSQQKERARLQSEIQAEQKTIATISEERAPIAAEVRKVEAEVGPIKYVAELVYGDSAEETIGKAVRMMIILIIFVFDPLAILLLIAANMELKKIQDSKKPIPVEKPIIIKEPLVPPVKRKPKAKPPAAIKKPLLEIKKVKHYKDKKINIASGDDVVIIQKDKIHKL
jgi:ElaB/YqjD/DUF883 family membrane-anchored ribosome-binding protein